MKATTVQEGYYQNGEFTSRRNYYDSVEVPPGFDLTEKEQEEFDDGDQQVYRTTDGKLFLDYQKAQDHAKTVSVPELDEVMELLAKVQVLCDLNKGKSPVLETIKDAVSKIQSDPDYLMDKYYDSTC